MLALVLSVCSSRLFTKKSRNTFCLIAGLIAALAACEWLSVYLHGFTGGWTVVSCLANAYIFVTAPCLAYVFAQSFPNSKHNRVMLGLLLFNGAFVLVSCFAGFVFWIDTDGNYHRGAFYFVYVIVYVASFAYMLAKLIATARAMQSRRYPMLFMCAVIIAFAVVFQMIDSSVRVIWVSVAVAACILYIYYLDTFQQVDALTSLLNRRGYETAVSRLAEPATIITFDLDSFKQINDTYGHLAGDECLRVVGRAIMIVYGREGDCFRTGGDEMCAILKGKRTDIDDMNSHLFNRLDELRKSDERLPHVSVGYAYYEPDKKSVEEAFAEADEMMYHYKERAKALRAEQSE